MIERLVEELIYGLRLRDVEEADDAEREARRSFLLEQQRLEFLDAFRADIESALSSFHDYRQINSQIIQLANVLIERESGQTFEDKMGSVDSSILAIYEASKFLDEKLTVGTLLIDRAWLQDDRECVQFRVHGMAHKYVQIHRARAERKGVSIVLDGVSYRTVVGSTRGSGVIMHTLLDNAVKYAPSRSQVRLSIADGADGSVTLSVTSTGPEILTSERAQIFSPFFRGEKAREFSDEGSVTACT